MLLPRLAVASVGIPVVVALVLIGGPLMLLALVTVALIGIAELHRLVAALDVDFNAAIAAITTTGLVVAGSLGLPILIPIAFGLLASGTIGIIGLDLTRPRAILAWPLGVFSAIYVGVPLALLAEFGADRTTIVSPWDALGPITLPRGAIWILVALVLTWSADTAAFAVGRIVGRHALAPAISPRKSLEGTIAGVILPAGIAAVVAPALQTSVALGIGFGLTAGAAAVLGDLAESALKRAARVKDSGTVFPGHGGLLDRIDSLLFVVPVVALWARLVTGRVG